MSYNHSSLYQKAFFKFAFIFALSISCYAQPDTIVLLPEKTKGNKIIPNKFLSVFQKANDEMAIFKNEKFPECEIVLFRLRLKGEMLSLYCLTIKKDSIIKYIFDADNDKDFTNNELKTFGSKDAEPMTEPVEFNYGNGKTWVGIKSLNINYEGRLTNMVATIYEYRLAKLQNKDATFQIRIEAGPDLRYNYPAIIKNTDSFHESVDEKIKLDEFITLGTDIYKFIYCSQDGDTLKLVSVNKTEKLASTQKGYNAKDIKGIGLSGDSISLKAYNGKFVLLDFWFSSCGACVEEMKELLAGIYDEYGGDYFEIVGVNVIDNIKVASDFMRENKYNWPQIISPLDSPSVKAYHINSFPTYFFLDTKGKIIENDFKFLQDLPYLLNRHLPEDYLVKKLLSKKDKFSYSGFRESKYSMLYIMNSENVTSSFYLYNHAGKWQYSLDLNPGTYYYYFYFDRMKVTDPGNPKTKEIYGNIYSELKIGKH